MATQLLISQEKILELTRAQYAIQAALLPEPKNGSMLMKVRGSDQNGDFEAVLAMVNKPEARVFLSLESAWKLTRKLGIKSLVVDNDKFNGAAA